MLNAISQTEKDKYDFVYIWNLKNKTNEQKLKKKKTRNRVIDTGNKQVVAGGEGEGEGDGERKEIGVGD